MGVLVPGVDGGALLNAFRMGVQDRMAREQFAQTQQDRELERQYTKKKMDREDEAHNREQAMRDAYARIFGDQPESSGATSPTATNAVDPQKIRSLMALGPQGVAAAKAIVDMDASQRKAARDAAQQALEDKAKLVNGIMALPPEQREQAYQQVRRSLSDGGQDMSRLPEHWDEDQINMLIRQSMGIADALGVDLNKARFAHQVNQDAIENKLARERLGVSQGALALARQREGRVAKQGSGGGEDDSVDSLLNAAGL